MLILLGCWFTIAGCSLVLVHDPLRAVLTGGIGVSALIAGIVLRILSSR